MWLNLVMGRTISNTAYLADWAEESVSKCATPNIRIQHGMFIPFNKDDLVHLAQKLKWELECKRPDIEIVNIVGWLFSVIGERGHLLNDESKLYIRCSWEEGQKDT